MRINRDCMVPVITIRSFNRANYHGPASMEAFILKNRNGQTNKGAAFTYKPLFNHFKEGGESGMDSA